MLTSKSARQKKKKKKHLKRVFSAFSAIRLYRTSHIHLCNERDIMQLKRYPEIDKLQFSSQLFSS